MRHFRPVRRLSPVTLILLLCSLGVHRSAEAQLPQLTPSSPVSPSPVAPLPGPAATVPTSALANSDYVLGPGDQVAVTVYGYEEFEGSRAVLPDGNVSMPLVGPVRAEGKTLPAFSQDLTTQLQPYLVNPVVSVSLTVLRPIVVNVAGEVYRPGPIQLSSLTDVSTRIGTDSRITSSSNAPTLSAALSAAGGVTRMADIRQVILRRTLPGGRNEATTIDLWSSLGSEQSLDNIVLRDGDSVFVPEVTAADEINPRLVARSSFAPATIRVRVVGEVKRPGEVEVPPNSSLSSAVAIAGGPTEDAELDDVRLVRLNENGQVEDQELDLSRLVDEYQVQDGDVVYVPKEGIRSVIDFASRLFSPLNFILNLFE